MAVNEQNYYKLPTQEEMNRMAEQYKARTLEHYNATASRGIRKCTPEQLYELLTVLSYIKDMIDYDNLNELFSDGGVFALYRHSFNAFFDTIYGYPEEEYNEHDDTWYDYYPDERL